MTAQSIYIVEDEEAVRHSLEQLLAEVGTRTVLSFASGEAFLERAAKLAPGCVLLDLRLPGIDGIRVMQKLREQALPFAIVIMTGMGDVRLAVTAIKAGAADFLEKPYERSDVMAALDQGFRQLAQHQDDWTRTRTARQKVDILSRRELDVLQGLIEGQPNKVIAHELTISVRTVEIHRANLMDKLGTHSLSETLRIGFDAGLALRPARVA